MDWYDSMLKTIYNCKFWKFHHASHGIFLVVYDYKVTNYNRRTCIRLDITEAQPANCFRCFISYLALPMSPLPPSALTGSSTPPFSLPSSIRPASTTSTTSSSESDEDSVQTISHPPPPLPGIISTLSIIKTHF